MICKYKFQEKEYYDGKPYCTLFGELCEDVFAELGYEICEDICQVFEDNKEYERLINQYNAVVEQNKQLQKELNVIRGESWRE